MDYKRIPYVDKPISPIVFGTATRRLDAVMTAAPDEKDACRREAFALLDAVLAAGINAFDCSALYGEEVLGDWMQSRGIRDRVVILSKCAHPDERRNRVTEADILSDIHDSLARLKTDHIDICVLHRDDPTVPVGVIVETMNRLHWEGKIGAFGGSNWTHERIAEANRYAAEHGLIPFSVSSPNLCLAEQIDNPWMGECISLSGPAGASAERWYRDNGVAVFAYSALGRGFLSGAFRSDEPEKAKAILEQPALKGYFHPRNFERLSRAEQLAFQKGVTVAQIALAWLLCQPLAPFAVTGFSSEAHLQETVAAAEIRLTGEEIAWLNLTEK